MSDLTQRQTTTGWSYYNNTALEEHRYPLVLASVVQCSIHLNYTGTYYLYIRAATGE